MIQCLLEIDDAVSVIVIALNNNLKLKVEEEDEKKTFRFNGRSEVENQHSDMRAHGVKKSKK